MSHEILVISGSPGAEHQALRRQMLTHAANHVPGANDSTVVETETTNAALVETSPQGGTFAYIQRSNGQRQISIATAHSGLEVAKSDRVAGHQCGGEAGHISVQLCDDSSVSITNDGVAYIPAFWADFQGQLLFSTHLASMVSLGLPSTPDEQAILEYLAMLHPLDQRTILKFAHALPAGAILQWDPRLGTRCKAHTLFTPQVDALSDDEALAHFGDIWSEVVGDLASRTASFRPALGLSGGLDSRAIATTAAELGFKPFSYTYGTTRNYEVRIAQQVATTLGLPHMQIPVTDDRLLRDAPHITATLDGAHSPAEMYESWFTDILASFSDVVINGLDGDILWGNDKALGIDSKAGMERYQAKRIGAQLSPLQPLLMDDVASSIIDDVNRGLFASMEQWDFSGRSDMIVFWRLANRQLRWGNMLVTGLRRAGVRCELPFRDSRFLNFAAMLTPKQRLHGNLYLRAQREIFSRTANIRRSSDGNRPNNLSHIYWSADTSVISQLARLTVRHPVSGIRRSMLRGADVAAENLPKFGVMGGAASYLSERSDVFPGSLWARTRPVYAVRLAELLEGPATHKIFAPDAVTRAAESLRQGRPTVTPLALAKVATVNYWTAEYAKREENARRNQDVS